MLSRIFNSRVSPKIIRRQTYLKFLSSQGISSYVCFPLNAWSYLVICDVNIVDTMTTGSTSSRNVRRSVDVHTIYAGAYAYARGFARFPAKPETVYTCIWIIQKERQRRPLAKVISELRSLELDSFTKYQSDVYQYPLWEPRWQPYMLLRRIT